MTGMFWYLECDLDAWVKWDDVCASVDKYILSFEHLSSHFIFKSRPQD